MKSITKQNFLLPLEKQPASWKWTWKLLHPCLCRPSIHETTDMGSSCFSKITPHCKKGQNKAMCGAKCGNGQPRHWPIQPGWNWCRTSLVTIEKLDEKWHRISLFYQKSQHGKMLLGSVTSLLLRVILHHHITQARNLSMSLRWTAGFLSPRSILRMILQQLSYSDINPDLFSYLFSTTQLCHQNSH